MDGFFNMLLGHCLGRMLRGRVDFPHHRQVCDDCGRLVKLYVKGLERLQLLDGIDRLEVQGRTPRIFPRQALVHGLFALDFALVDIQ